MSTAQPTVQSARPFELFERQEVRGTPDWQYEASELNYMGGQRIKLNAVRPHLHDLCDALCQSLERVELLEQHPRATDPFVARQVTLLRTDIEAAVRSLDDLLVAQLGVTREFTLAPEER